MELTLTWRSRTQNTLDRGPQTRFVSDQNDNWSCSWLSWVQFDPASPNQATVNLPYGGRISFTFTTGNNIAPANYQTHASLQRFVNGSGVVTAFWLNYPNGSRYEYNTLGTIGTGYYLNYERDATGLATQFSYDGSERLNTVTAADGKVFTFTYNSFPLDDTWP